MQNFPQVETQFLLPGAAGNIEILTSPVPEGVAPSPAVAIICHPHPLFGGTMQNKVVSTLARAFGNLGLRTVRFQFRGVGKSDGVHDNGIGEQADLLTIMAWVKQVCPEDKIVLSGFSFGAAVSALVAAGHPVAQLVSIAPPVPRFNLPQLTSVPCPWLIVQGEEDDVVIPQDVYDWVARLQPQPDLIRIPSAGHFFHGQLLVLRNALEQALRPSLS